MTRVHRLAHRFVWPFLALATAAMFVAAIAQRPPPDPPAAQEQAR